jgi:arylsulfatase A-like enzyme
MIKITLFYRNLKSIRSSLLLKMSCIILCSFNSYAVQSKPNVIVIMTDDQGYPELSIHGNPILKTPNLDKLAESSVRFGDFHVSPMCAPTRGQLLTGMDAARNGTVNVSGGRELLNPELLTMGDIFKENGYRTGIFGKWHLGDNYPFRPEDRGFMETGFLHLIFRHLLIIGETTISMTPI